MNERPVRLVLATTLWKRPALTDAVLGHYARLRASLTGRLDLVLLAVGSEGQASREPCERNGFAYLEHPNDPVTDKWNAVVAEARRLDPAGVVLVNSDDLVSESLFDTYADRLMNGCDYLGLRDSYVLDLAADRLGRWPGYEASYMRYRIGEPAGCARGFSRRLLDTTAWRLWPPVPRKSASMDFWCTRFLALHGFEPHAASMRELGGCAVQIKTDVNITGIERLPLEGLRAGLGSPVLASVASPETRAALAALRRSLLDRRGEGGELPPYRYAGAGRVPIHRIEDIEPPALRDQLIAELAAMARSVRQADPRRTGVKP